MERRGSRQNQQRSRSRSPIHIGIRTEPGIHNRSSIYMDNLNFRYYTHNVTANKRQLRCVNHYSMQCRGRGSINLDDTDFRMTRPHTCVPRPSISSDENDNRTSLLITLRQRATREQTNLRTIYNEEIQRFPSAPRFVTYVQASRSMQRARRRHQPPTPSTTREWGVMLRSEEWRYRYINTIGIQTQFYQGELVNERTFYGLIFSNTQLVRTMIENLITVSILAIDGTYQCLPNHPNDLRQLLTVHIIHNNMSFPVAYACLISHRQAAYETVMNFILHLSLPYSDGPVQVITDFETGLRNAIRRVFPEWQQVGCSFHFNQAVLRHVRQIDLANMVRDNVMARNIVRLLLALPHLPSNRNVLPNIQGFTISEGLMMVRAIAIEQQVFEELRPLFNYFERYWMRVIGPEGFSVYGVNHRTNNFVESFHASLLGYLGVHPSLWTFYDLLRGVENITRLEMHQILNGQQVRRRFTSSRNRNNANINNALQDIQNGNGDTMVFLRRIAFINETFVTNTLGYNGQIFDDPQEDVEEVTAPVPRDSPIQRPNDDLAENVPSGRIENVPGRTRRETWGEFFLRMEGGNYVEEVTAPVPRDSPIQRPNDDLAEIVEVCIICFDEETNVTLRPCNHAFCNTCTIKLMEDNFNTCPLCRASIVEYDGIQL